MDYEKRTRLREHEDGSTEEETYTATMAVTENMEIFNRIKMAMVKPQLISCSPIP